MKKKYGYVPAKLEDRLIDMIDYRINKKKEKDKWKI
jgi:hypothetical protein